MKEIKTIGIIGMGTIGISIATILEQSGLNVIGFKHESRGIKMYNNFMEKGRILVINRTVNNVLGRRNTLKIKITSSLQEIADKSDLILNCCRFPQNSTIYQFNEFEKLKLKRKNTPMLILPGNLGSTWLAGKADTNVGLIGYAPVFATKKATPSGININLLDFKSKIPLAYDDSSTRMHLLNFLNRHFRFKDKTPTFIDGGSPIKTALSSPISAINAVAICDNAKMLIHSKGRPITEEIYVLSEEYAHLFEKVFLEQMMVARVLQISNLQRLKDWLLNRAKNIQSNNIVEMLEEVYKGKYVSISGQDRRLTESFYALLFFKYFANTLGCAVPTTEALLKKINNLQKAINKSYFSSDINLSIQQSAVSYAKYIVKKRKLKECNVPIVVRYPQWVL